MASEERFAAVRSRLESHGWQLVRISGSHHIFHGQGRPLLSIPVHKGRVKGVYVKEVERAIARLGTGE